MRRGVRQRQAWIGGRDNQTKRQISILRGEKETYIETDSETGSETETGVDRWEG